MFDIEKNELEALEQTLGLTRRALSCLDSGAIPLAKSDFEIVEMMLDSLVRVKRGLLKEKEKEIKNK